MDHEEQHVGDQSVGHIEVHTDKGEAPAEDEPERLQDAGQDEVPLGSLSASSAMSASQDKATAEFREADKEHEDEAIPYPEPENEDSNLLPPPDFRPFFTLIEDSNSDHHHPSVHYIFADDDPEILTAAALETLSTPQSDGDPPDQRFIVIDMAADGKEVVSASSLASDWQALTTKISPAPSWGERSEKGTADRGMMLTICGHEARQENATLKGKGKQGGSVDALLKAFDVNLAALDSVLGPEVTNVDTRAT